MVGTFPNNPISLFKEPPMHSGKGQKGNLSALHLCRAGNVGLPQQDS
jgi:hypothetical protein